jgi:hypothetical protein
MCSAAPSSRCRSRPSHRPGDAETSGQAAERHSPLLRGRNDSGRCEPSATESDGHRGEGGEEQGDEHQDRSRRDQQEQDADQGGPLGR